MRLLLAGALATVTVGSLAAIRPAVLTDAERAAALAVHPQRMRADVRFLSSDLLDGRTPGTPGDRLAREYLASRFEAIGLEPASGSSWEQAFDVVGVTAACPATVRVTRGGRGFDLRFPGDYVAFSGLPAPEARVDDAEIVFVGHGIVAPEYGWDDFKGADLRGRVLLVMNDEPGGDPSAFAGKRRLHSCGRGDAKLDLAARLGAAGAILIHTDGSAGCAWPVVEASFTGEQLGLPAAEGPAVPVKAWATEEASRRIAALAGHDLDVLRAAAARRDFRPVPLGVRMSLTLRNRVSRRVSANVVGLLRGRDPELAGEAVVYTAHHDHPGPRPGPSGLATLLAVAEAFSAMPGRPRRSVLFAAVATEEEGLLGSEHLARHPPVARLVANLDIDGASVRGRTRDVPVVGLGKTSLDDWIRAVAEAQGRTVVPGALPGEGAYGRSDQLSFTRAGVPAVRVDVGDGAGDLAGAVEDARLLFFLGAKVADAPLAPSWRPGDELEAPGRGAAVARGRY